MQRQSYFDQILAIICSVFDAYSAVLFLEDGGADTFQLAGKFSLGDHIDPDSIVSRGKGLVGRILTADSPVLLNNFDKAKGRLEYYREGDDPKIKAFMGCEVRGGVGVLCLDSKRTHSFSEKDQKILHLFANYIAASRQKTEQADSVCTEALYHGALKRIQELRKVELRWNVYLRQVLESVAVTSGFGYCFFAVRDDRGKNFYLEGASEALIPGNSSDIRFSMGSGLVGWVFKNDAPVFFGSKDATRSPAPLFGNTVQTPEIKSVICIPLVVNKITRCVLGLASEHPQELSQPLKDFALMVADYMELFMDTLYLKSQVAEAKAAAKSAKKSASS